MASFMAERLALLRSFELYAHEAAELDQAKNFQRKVSSLTSESESDSTSGSETSTKSGSGGEEVAGKTHGDGEDSEIEFKRKRHQDVPWSLQCFQKRLGSTGTQKKTRTAEESLAIAT